MLRFLLGLITGAAVGLLLAPKTGKETQEIVAARATPVLEKARDYVAGLLEQIRAEQATQGAEEDSDSHLEVARS